jgi:hypothetical protein
MRTNQAMAILCSNKMLDIKVKNCAQCLSDLNPRSGSE